MANLTERLAKKGLTNINIIGDGNCLFRALFHQMEGDERSHKKYRMLICNYIEAHKLHFQNYCLTDKEEGFDEYLCQMRSNRTFGGHQELVAFANLSNCQIEVFRDDSSNLTIIDPKVIVVDQKHDKTADLVDCTDPPSAILRLV